jgi:hypothetical protein
VSLFSEVKPQWDNVGTEPSGAKKTAGWLPSEKPPAEWFNWLFNRNYKCIDELRTVVDALSTASLAANVVVSGTSATGNDTYVISPSPAIAAYASGMVVELIVDVGNTAGATINVSAKGAKTIKKITSSGLVTLATGDMISSGSYILVYDGTDFILQNPNSINTSLLTAAGDIIQASGANTPVRLALGTALQMLRVNSGATALEYATPLQMSWGNYTGNGSGSRDISLGFSPMMVMVFNTSSSGGSGIGVYGSSTGFWGYGAGNANYGSVGGYLSVPICGTNKFTVPQNYLNINSQSYYYIAIG